MATSKRTSELHRRWRLAHLGERAAYMRDWRRNNPLASAAHGSARTANARARLHSAAGHLCGADILALWERQPVCMQCGKGRGVDHIVAFSDGGANVPENLQTLCKPCNAAKEYAAAVVRPGQTYCYRSHSQSAENVWTSPRTGAKQCRLCNRERDRRRNVHGRSSVQALT